MLYLVFIPFDAEFMMVTFLSVLNVIGLLIYGLWYMFMSKVYNEGTLIPLLWTIMAILFPVLIVFVPSLMSRWGGNLFAIVVLLWDLFFFIVIFIMFIHLINSKKNALLETEVEKPSTKEMRTKDDSGMKTGAVIINICAQLLLILSLLGLTWPYLVDGFLMTLKSVISILILIGGIYSLYSNKYFTFGSIICVVGGFSMIIFPFFYRILWSHGFMFPLINDTITITLGILPIIGVILHHMKLLGGSILCGIMGSITFVISFLMVYSGIGGGFLTIIPSIQFEPILMIIGGYVLYQERIKT